MEFSVPDSEQLLSSLRQRGIKLWLDSGQLRFRAPRGALHAEELAVLRAHKPELVRLLAQGDLEADAPLERRDATVRVPLTAAQRRWRSYINDHQGGLTERLCHVTMRVHGPLDVGRLQACLTVLVERHEPLRTRIVVNDATAEQLVEAPSACHLAIVDLSRVAADERDSEVSRQCEQFMAEKVDLANGPLFAARLFALSNQEHVLTLTLEHMVADGASTSILHKELWALYQRDGAVQPSSLPEAPLQFADYAVWQERTHQAWLQLHQGYWERHLTGAVGLRLPRAREIKPSREFPACVISRFPFGRALTDALRELARRERTLLSLVVLAIYVIVIFRWCRQHDFVLIFISNGRNRPELQNMVGYLANLLHLRIQVSETDTFGSLLERLSEELRAAYEHEDFDRVPHFVPACSTELDFNWISTHWMWETRPPAGSDLRIEPFALEAPWVRPFLPAFFDTPDGVVATVISQPCIFTADTVARFGSSLQHVARAVAQFPLVELAAIPVN
jgi:surfactin family lipopeptide synthetase A